MKTIKLTSLICILLLSVAHAQNLAPFAQVQSNCQDWGQQPSGFTGYLPPKMDYINNGSLPSSSDSLEFVKCHNTNGRLAIIENPDGTLGFLPFEHYFDYVWESYQRISRIDITWWTTPNTVKAPDEARLSYLNKSNQWVDIGALNTAQADNSVIELAQPIEAKVLRLETKVSEIHLGIAEWSVEGTPVSVDQWEVMSTSTCPMPTHERVSANIVDQYLESACALVDVNNPVRLSGNSYLLKTADSCAIVDAATRHINKSLCRAISKWNDGACPIDNDNCWCSNPIFFRDGTFAAYGDCVSPQGLREGSGSGNVTES
ncbi:MAG: hypothetical protein AAGB12_16975 [Pseudomonadota bacterium]